jgi:rsbT co-antagonist protein RsbR
MTSSSPAPQVDLDLSDGLLLQVASGAPIVISIYDMAGTFLLHAGAGLKKLGLAQNQLRGQSVFVVFAGAEDALAKIRGALAGQESTNTQDLGETVWDNWFGPVYDRSGKQIGGMSISTDVTERERSRQALEQRIQEIEAQNLAIRSMSAPIIEVWQGVLVVPVVGQLDAPRAALLIDRLLSTVSERAARHAIIDLTAVDVLDPETAKYVIRMITALRLLGTRGLISGIRASVAQSLVGLGVDLSQVTTMSTLHAALRRCMQP